MLTVALIQQQHLEGTESWCETASPSLAKTRLVTTEGHLKAVIYWKVILQPVAIPYPTPQPNTTPVGSACTCCMCHSDQPLWRTCDSPGRGMGRHLTALCNQTGD